MFLRALDGRLARRIELHGPEWDVFCGEDRPVSRGAEIAMRSCKTGHIYWWPEFHIVDTLDAMVCMFFTIVGEDATEAEMLNILKLPHSVYDWFLDQA
jgi:hypothetical protein